MWPKQAIDLHRLGMLQKTLHQLSADVHGTIDISNDFAMPFARANNYMTISAPFALHVCRVLNLAGITNIQHMHRLKDQSRVG